MSGQGKLLLYCWTGTGLSVLVPKKRGHGFLRVPYGHHEDEGLSYISRQMGCDIFGLDGALDFQCGEKDAAGRATFEGKAMKLLEIHYGMKSSRVGWQEYWDKHPVKEVVNEEQ